MRTGRGQALVAEHDRTAGPAERPDRRLFAPSCRCLPGGGGAQIIYSAACAGFSRRGTPVGSARTMCCLWVVNTGARLRCLAQPPIATLAGPDFRPGVLAGPRRLRRCAVPCCVPLTDPVTATVIFCRCWGSGAHGSGEGAELSCKRAGPGGADRVRRRARPAASGGVRDHRFAARGPVPEEGPVLLR